MVDYAVVVLSFLAQRPLEPFSANRLALELRLNQPTLAKICGLLSQANLLSATRGVQGGYCLMVPAQQISLKSVIEAIEGRRELVNCTSDSQGDCPCFEHCSLGSSWKMVEHRIESVLEGISVAELSSAQIKQSPIREKNE